MLCIQLLMISYHHPPLIGRQNTNFLDFQVFVGHTSISCVHRFYVSRKNNCQVLTSFTVCINKCNFEGMSRHYAQYQQWREKERGTEREREGKRGKEREREKDGKEKEKKGRFGQRDVGGHPKSWHCSLRFI